MIGPSKFFTCIVILALLVSSMATVAVCADTPAVKPSVPEFTLEVVDFSHDVPPRNETDVYTGEVRTIPGYHVENKTIKLSVNNQPTNFRIDEKTYHTYLAIKLKPHFDTEWKQSGSNYMYTSGDKEYGQVISSDSTLQSKSNYTVFWYLGDWEPNATMDFQVQAMRGHDTKFSFPRDPLSYRTGYAYRDVIAFDASSDWSEVQSITIPPDPTPTPDQTSSAESWLVWTWETTATVLGSLVVLLLIVIAVLLVHIKKLHTKKPA